MIHCLQRSPMIYTTFTSTFRFADTDVYHTGDNLNGWIRSRDEAVLLNDQSTFCHYVGSGAFALFATPVSS